MAKKSLSKEEAFLYAEGTWRNCYDVFGAHPYDADGEHGYQFTLWAPGVRSVKVIGSFNNWDEEANPMKYDKEHGVWQIRIPNVESGDTYKYLIETRVADHLYKADPYAFYAEVPSDTASRVFDLRYKWQDGKWMEKRRSGSHFEKPLNIYEVHFGSWKRKGTAEQENYGEMYSYSEMSELLVNYVKDMGYTHIELLPMMEHPFDGSWGYQITSYYAPTSRYGTPSEFMHFIDVCHQNGIGVILDWVPGHFCKDEHGLRLFNGLKLYEEDDHATWGTCRFDFRKGEVRSFLISNALFWLRNYHVDGLRVDGVTSMLYLNFGIDDEKQKRYNINGGEENLEAISFIRELNKAVGEEFPDVMMMAEESTAWPLVTYPPHDGGLGFHYKWDMGWMHDTLHYMQTDFPYRKGNHNLLTFSIMYAFNENFICALSHDEVVHGKCSLIVRQPGDYWRQFAGLRLLALYQMTHPGAKLNFMGSEIAEFIEWRYYEGLEWFLPEKYESHRKHQEYIKELNHVYLSTKSLWEKSYTYEGFEWIDADNSQQSIISYIRKGHNPKDDVIVVLNFTPETYENFQIGVNKMGAYHVIFSSDEEAFGGSGFTTNEKYFAKKKPMHNRPCSISIRIPPLGGVIIKK